MQVSGCRGFAVRVSGFGVASLLFCGLGVWGGGLGL